MAGRFGSLLKSEALALPRSRDDEDFLRFLSTLLADYRTQIRSLRGRDKLTLAVKAESEQIAALCAGIEEVMTAYLQGFPHRAFLELRRQMKSILRHVEQLLKKRSRVEKNLYRMRIGSRKKLTEDDLFHVPFESRHRVRTQRYSIPGLPSLYLGGSLYTCWEEMGRPPYHEIQMSAFWPKGRKPIRLLDFGYRPIQLKKHFDDDGKLLTQQKFKLIVGYAVCWPLIASCSIKSRHSDAPFKPEYIMPQLVLQWLTSQKSFHGIRYFSTRIDSEPQKAHWFSNYVFPGRQQRSKGRCPELDRMWLMSEPLGWQLAESIDLAHETTETDFDDFAVEIGKSLVVPYKETAFGKMQALLNARVQG